jgi:hypothetical protein
MIKINKIYETNRNIELSVAIPCYNGKDIAWLCMEGLCNQKNIDFDWEIVICEENHENMIGVDFFYQYIERLSHVGCKKITYLGLDGWVNLVEKWKIIGQHLDCYDGCFIMQAIDCFSQPLRFSQTHNILIEKNYDWCDFNKGYFYSFVLDKLIQYNNTIKGRTHLNMGFKSKYAKQLISDKRLSIVDGFLLNHIKKLNPKMKHFTFETLIPNGIDTDGYNNISKKRINYYTTTKHPFSPTTETIKTIGLPEDVVEKIIRMRKNNEPK